MCPFRYKEHEECRDCDYNRLDVEEGESWHCALDLSMLGKKENFLVELVYKCERVKNSFEEEVLKKVLDIKEEDKVEEED